LSELLEAYAEHKTDSLRAVLERWKKAVEGLTPSGSEFVDDPENCAAYIRKRTQYPQIIINLRAGNERLRGELADMQATFDLSYNANLRGIKLWQDANPGNELVWPDQAKLVEWLLGELAQAKREHAGSLVKEVQDHIDELAVAERRAEAAESQVERLKQALEWIPVSERLPKEFERVLILDNEKHIHLVDHRPDSAGSYWDCDTYGLRKVDASYWMPLPAPPEARAALESKEGK